MLNVLLNHSIGLNLLFFHDMALKLNVIPPTNMDLSLHHDWSINYSNSLFKQTSFKYKSVDFKEIAESSRK